MDTRSNPASPTDLGPGDCEHCGRRDCDCADRAAYWESLTPEQRAAEEQMIATHVAEADTRAL